VPALLFRVMGANRKLKPNLKSYVGRTFGIRKYSLIIIYENERANGNGRTAHRDDIGEAVMVLDESNSRVRIILASGGTGWIAKYYLHKEIKSVQFAKFDALASLIEKLTTLYDLVDEKDILSKADITLMIKTAKELGDIDRNKILNIKS